MYPIQAYLKSAFYLVAFTGTGYVLMKLSEPSAEKLKKIRSTGSSPSDLTYEQKKTQLMLDTIKGSVSKKPVYLQSPEEIKRETAAAAGKVE